LRAWRPDAAWPFARAAVATSKAVAKRNPAFAHFKYMGLPDRAEYRKWLASPVAGRPSEPGHTTSPFVYVQDGAFVGGCDDFIEYCRKLGVLQ
jgi:glutaredoxin